MTFYRRPEPAPLTTPGLTGTHRRSWWRLWRCRCGRRWLCGALDLARTEARRQHARQAAAWYPAYFATRPPAAQRFTPPAGTGQRAVGRATVPTPGPMVRPYVQPHGNRGWFR
jgi:hypothetical protein